MKAPVFFVDVHASASPDIQASGDAHAGLDCVWTAETARVWADRYVITVGEHGVIIGHLFTRSLPSRRVTALASEEIAEIHASSGRSLLQHFWGGYVAILSIGDGDILILRDPSGTVPAYWRRHRQGIAIGSEIGRPPFTADDGLPIDAEALASYLLAPNELGARTCIVGVSELLPGQALRIRSERFSVETLWSPWDHVPTDGRFGRIDPQELLETIDDTILSWGRCFPSILIGISGGLDSSIVSSALAGSGAVLHGLTMVGPDPEGDERDYARQVAETFGMVWETAAYRLDEIDIELPIATHVSRPLLSHYVQAIAHTRDRLARHKPIDAYFSGNGGDNVFCLMRSATPLVDRLAVRSRPMSLLRTLGDIAALTEADLFTILRSALSRFMRGTVQSVIGADPSFLCVDRVIPIVDTVNRHPWHEAPQGVLPGAISHVRMIQRAYGNDGFHSRWTHPPSINPLLAQPIVELCLRIPSWAWVEGGMDRAVARTAYRGRIPETLLQRRSKGGPGGFVDRIYRRNEAAVLSMLRKGMLRDLEIVDDIDRSLSQFMNFGVHPFLPQRLLALAAAESWARSWTGHQVANAG